MSPHHAVTNVCGQNSSTAHFLPDVEVPGAVARAGVDRHGHTVPCFERPT
jgi:hypothetical protein